MFSYKLEYLIKKFWPLQINLEASRNIQVEIHPMCTRNLENISWRSSTTHTKLVDPRCNYIHMLVSMWLEPFSNMQKPTWVHWGKEWSKPIILCSWPQPPGGTSSLALVKGSNPSSSHVTHLKIGKTCIPSATVNLTKTSTNKGWKDCQQVLYSAQAST